MSKEKRIKIFVDGDVLVHKHFSGIGHYTAEILKALDRLLYDERYSRITVEVGVPLFKKHELGKYGFNNFAIRTIPLPLRFINKLRNKDLLPPLDLFFGKKLYIFPNYSSWPTLFSKSVPIVYDLSFIKFPQFVEPQNQKLLTKEVQKSIKRSFRVITISMNSKKEISDYYKYAEDDIEILFPAVDMHNFYRRSTDEIEFTKAKYGVFGDYIIFVGNLEPRKNLITLLKAYDNLPKKIQEKYSLLLVGAKGWLNNDITKYIIDMRTRGLRVIQPIDYVNDNDIPALYSGAKLSAYVSVYEGFGIPPIESMACGTPVIASDNSSIPEAVGDAAIKISALDDRTLTKEIIHLLGDESLRKKYISLGYEQINRYSWEKSAEDLITLAEESL